MVSQFVLQFFPYFFQLQMERVEQYELWEKNKRREMQYIKTTTSVEGQPQIFYLPKVNQDIFADFQT